MPKVIYCLHALSTHLFKRGQAPLIEDLYGKIDFSGKETNFKCLSIINYLFYILAETITATRKELAENGIELPKFQKIAGLLSEDVKGEDTLTLHEAIKEINNAVISKVIK